MAPTPYTASGRMVFGLTILGREHLMHYACNVVLVLVPIPHYEVATPEFSVASMSGLDVADNWWSLVRGFYSNNITAPSWSVEQRVGAVFIPRTSGVATALNGVASSPPVQASVITCTFKDAENRHVRLAFPETAIAVPIRYNMGALPGSFANLFNSVLSDDPGSLEIGSWARGRGNADIDRGVHVTGTLSKKLRRQRGLL